MLYTTCVVIILASVCNASTQNVPSEMETFTNVMLSEAKRLCPLANICGNNNLTDETKIETGKISCCEDCSCDANCSKRGDCCFPTEAEKVALLDQRKQQECIASVTLDLLPAEYTKYRFYYMTTSCPDEQDSGQNNTFDCGNVHVAPWGSLFPIYSKSTGKIYKNRACADCHGVRDGVEWFAYMNCKAVDKSQTRYLTVAENINPFSYNSFSEYCQIYFTPTQTIDTEICFPDIIDTCTDTEAMIPEMSEMTSNDVIEACVNGVFAPFHSRYTYANAFCFLCNGGVISIAENCFKVQVEIIWTARE
ncbi:uncharacterized protein LOC132749690 [Ruditapes philippinarum]|uniref:uncharacterized protein LOC132749690 n=1 Tax=Ruditapes philippinarum TaxID=129788 RepID=UPI00295A5982|nr:uncharacterized protein LOC132749690 [Ruditapes philippinarum]